MDYVSETELEGDTEIEMGMIEDVVYSQEFLPTFETIPEGASVPKVEKAEFNGKSDSLFFNDGVRRIDFVLVYEDEDMKEIDKNRTFQKRKQRREYFEASLMKMGMELEAARSVVDEKLLFVKVHMPWDVLCTYAEVLHIKLPIQPNDLSTTSSPFNFLSCITRHFYPSEDLIAKETEYFTAPFEKDRLEYFYVKDRDLFFTPSMRSRMAYYILSRAPYEVRGNIKKFGVTKLLDGGVYKAAYPLHDCRFNVRSKEDECPNERYLLYNEWAHPKSFYKMQPLDLIRKYYGEKIGIYFAWLGFYTAMLALAAIVGLGCFIYGYTTQETSTWSKEVCDPLIGGNIVMCPQCDKECTYWRLNSTCESSKKLCIFDNYGTLVFAVFMAIWVTVFLEFWKRYQAELEYEWDTVEFLEQEEQPRPEYEAKCNHERINPVTRVKEKVPYTACGRCIRVSLGIGTVLFWIVLILASVVAIIVYRLAVFFSFSTRLQSDLKELEPFKEYVTAQMATSVTASIISFVVIMVLNILYERVAIWITDFELPRTKTDYENSLTLKMFLFQFVNYYSSCFYIAFAKGKVVGYPGQPVYLLGKYRNEECDPGGCLIELTTQLTVIMGGKAIWNNIQEVLLPWMKNLIFRYCTRVGSEKVIPRWEQDYQLQPIGKLGLFYEYLEMVIQFGFVTLFVASFPLAPVLALVNNLFEIRVDAWKIITQFRRMVPEKAQDIGAWQPILQGVAILAVASNAMIIAFTSDMIPRLVYYWSFSVYPYGDHSSHTMQGYINNTLSVFDIQDFSNKSRPLQTPYWFNNSTTCRYRDFRYPPGHHRQYEYSIYYWHVIAAKMAFIIVVEHIVYLTKFVLSYVIPDVPYTVREQIKREKYLSQVILHETNLKLVTKRLKPVADKILKHNEDQDEEMMDLYF
ncbi:anoctamin-6 isoform X1 [Salmo salar]|uniref:Anoctamin n=2 Tax=Salmo TaxID=8028 RepID=A0A674DJZ0_SALTR|nr:anoctamin-6-like isoform X1 [Salmo salar]XP_029617426.1 anoctamin-6-like isoform X2 [Salmo trutta]|eukprot:XP_014063925.1 PREDICTED: anoctamin-6-like isoform X1 [Salmo salar]